MVITTENAPFSLSIGLDLSLNEDYIYEDAFKYISSLQVINIDYIISPISVKNQDLRKKKFIADKNLNSSNCLKLTENTDSEKPIFINDFQMKFFYWKNKFISKIHQEDLDDIPSNFDIISQDLNYANYINSKSSIIEIDLEKVFLKDKPKINLKKINHNSQSVNDKIIISEYIHNEIYNDQLQTEFYLVKLIKRFFAENFGRHLSILLNFTKESFFFYTKLQNQINNVDNFEVLLKLEENLPDEVNKL